MTSSPLSSISYNTESFLKEKLQQWYDNHLIQCYMYICHKGEDGDKDHIHFRIEPNKRLDPMNLLEDLKEFDPTNDKPLGIRPFRPSIEEDWFLYVVHDKQYLKLKYGGGEKGEKLPYLISDIVTSPDYDTDIAFIRAKAKMEHTSANIGEKMRSGVKSIDLICQGENPFTVNAIQRSIKDTAYPMALNEITNLQMAIDNFGLIVSVDENGKYSLEPKSR